ncbi:MAG TPA: phosphatase PAP2 family protein [Longimicrobiales bacterium]
MARRIPVPLSLIAVLLPVSSAAAQEGRWATLREDAEHLVGDAFHVWTAPARVDGSDLAGFAAVAGAVVLVGVFDDEIQDWLRENPESLPVRALGPMREPRLLSRLGYTQTLAPLSGAVYLLGLVTRSDGLREAGIGCVTADLSNTPVRHLLARLLGRLRPEFTRDPYIIEPFAWGDWPMRSFPGGHVANIMACSTFWSNHFDLGGWSALLYAFSAAMGMARTVDGAHWTSDTLFGLVFGWAVGRAVAGRFEERDRPAADPRANAAVRPPGLTLGWRIRF